mgnify:CR=1 FL=1
MDEQKKLSDIEEAAAALIANSEDENPAYKSINKQKSATSEEKNDKKIFKKYKIKDIVFLAIITACTLITGSVMPLLVNVPLFGIVQLGIGLQFSIFPVIGMMKVRKPGALLLQSIFIAMILVFMFPPMVMIVLCGLIAETLSLLIFRSYKNDWACVLAGTLYMPMTLPLLYLYYNVFYTVTGGEKGAMRMFIGGGNAGIAVGISIGVLALCFVGAVVGMLIARELKKAGALKK